MKCGVIDAELFARTVDRGGNDATVDRDAWGYSLMNPHSVFKTSIVAMILVLSAGNAAFAEPLLDRFGLLPPNHNPASVPSSRGNEITTAVPMREDTRDAIRLFDASEQSKRHYDFVSCLDGLTFGFGNWPQAKMGAVMAMIREDREAYDALIKRAGEVFEADGAAWQSFAADARIPVGTKTAAMISDGLKRLFPVKGRANASAGINGDYTCRRPLPRTGASYYQDYKTWLVPLIRTAFRDPLIVAVQVHKWEQDVFDPAIEDAKRIGISGPGVFLVAFVKSNSGQAPALRAAINRGEPPTHLVANGKDWSWNTPPANLRTASSQNWQTLLMWQSMCPRGAGKFRIRNRNLLFFKNHLSKIFQLPSMRAGGLPDSGSRSNCDPSKVSLVRA